MKKVIILFACFFLIVSCCLFSQSPCLPEGITFTTQSQIDSFQVNYPGCTEILGGVAIEGQGYGISNLNGLFVITSIGGGLHIIGCWTLSSLSGLDNLTFIGEDLFLQGNGITSLTALSNLTIIGGDLRISFNQVTSLSGLENVNSVGGDIFITNNENLISLAGLENIETASIVNLSIARNESLVTCDVASICAYLANPNGAVIIHSNASGCNNPPEIAAACEILLPCLPYGNYYFLGQSEIDNFQEDYSNCYELNGFVEISGNGIANLDGLNVVSSINGDLYIYDNYILSSLIGLQNVNYINGWFVIGHNYSLTSLSGLEGIDSIAGSLAIDNNYNLTSLTGVDNIEEGSITDLLIYGNTSLSTCEVQSVCDYLVDPGGLVIIEYNDQGCNSPEEVQEACETVVIEEPFAGSACLIFPNPASDKLTLDCSGITDNIELIEIYNTFGVKMAAYRLSQTDTEITLDVQALPPGLYFLRLQAGNEVRTEKVIKR